MKPKKVLEFKTISPFFEMCRDGEKPFDIRKVDNKDPRFRALFQVRFQKNTRWAIKFTNPATGEYFVRWLQAWEYLTDENRYCIKPDWLIMYLGSKYPFVSDEVQSDIEL